MVGAQMARKRLTELRFPKEVIVDVSQLVELHLRFHGYGDGEWTDSAVRRYVRDAGPLLARLHALTRADCTTRNAKKAARLAATYDALEARIEVLRGQEELDKIRPELDGGEIMRILGLTPGPLVGKAWNYLLELRLSEGVVGPERATAELLAWAAREGIEVPPSS
jgi:poly(A) polymerase